VSLSLFQEKTADPKRGRKVDAALGDDLGQGKALLCAKCGRRITSEAARTEVGGHHLHTRVNPHGVQFTFGCYRQVEGCVLLSAPSSEWSWFPGYHWQIENCEGCARHLGWFFSAADHAFHGLVADRLVEGSSD
jgi:hypothetical protein